MLVTWRSHSNMASYVVGAIAGSLKTKNEKVCKKFLTLFEKSEKTLPASWCEREEPASSVKDASKKVAVSDEKKTSVNKYDRTAQRKRKRMFKLKNDPEEQSRTIFVGNIPIETSEKALNTLFQKYGKVESVRFRSVPVPDPGTSKRVAYITRTFNSHRNNMNAFVKFKNSDDAKAAEELNGFDFNGFRIRVDLLSNNDKNDHKKQVFVGNLPFDVEENALYDHFNDCGLIDGVRIIRDSKSGVGKGIGYVIFKSEDAVTLALHLNGVSLNGRELRISRAKPQEKAKKRKKPSQFENKFHNGKKRKITSSDISHSSDRLNVKDAKGKKVAVSDFRGEKYTDKQKLKLKKKKKNLKRKIAM